MKKRKNGEGNWGTRIINGTKYKYYRKYYDWKDDYHTFYGKTETEVNSKRDEFEIKNKDKHRLNKSNIPNETFYHYCIYWLKDIKPVDGSDTKEVTLDSYEEIIETRIKNTFLGNTVIQSLNKDIFEDYIFEFLLKKKGYSRATIKRTQSLLNQICEHLYKKDKYASENYIQDIKMPSEKNVTTKKKETLFLEESDMDLLYDEFNKTKKTGERKYGINSYIIIFIIYTGLRISECIALKWKDINFSLKILRVSHVAVKIKNKESSYPKHILVDTEGTKTYTSNRSIPLSSRALDILNELHKSQDQNNYIFSNDGKSILDSRNITRTLNMMQRNAHCKVEKCGLHSLRHTFGSYLILKGTDIKTVSELLGHSDIKVTLNIYVHIINAQKVASIKLFDEKDNPLSVESNSENKKFTGFLSDFGINLIEIEDGMLGYIENNKIVKLPINKSLTLGSATIDNMDIYKEYYKGNN